MKGIPGAIALAPGAGPPNLAQHRISEAVPAMFLVYLSRMVCAPDAVPQIVATARAHNAKAGVTGLLLNDRRHFLQVLEGPQRPIADTLLRIACDPRHADLTILVSEPTEARLFTRWTMASQPFADKRSTLAGFVATLADLDRGARLPRLQEFALSQCPPPTGPAEGAA